MKEIFGLYNVRSRLSVSVFVLSPLLILIFLTLPEARSLSSTIIFGLVLIPLSNLIIISSRELGVKAMKSCYTNESLPAQSFLLLKDTTLNEQTKQRYYSFLKQHISSFSISEDEQVMKVSAEDAVTWLIAQTRDSSKFPLIHEENMNFGFAYNLLGLKKIGILLTILSLAINLVLIYLVSFNFISYNIISLFLCFLLNLGIMLIWIFVISKSLVRSCGKKYARALLAACDNIKIEVE